MKIRLPHERRVGAPRIEVVAEIERGPGFEGFVAVIHPTTSANVHVKFSGLVFVPQAETVAPFVVVNLIIIRARKRHAQHRFEGPRPAFAVEIEIFFQRQRQCGIADAIIVLNALPSGAIGHLPPSIEHIRQLSRKANGFIPSVDGLEMQQVHILGVARVQGAAAEQQIALVSIFFDELISPAVIPTGHHVHDRFIRRKGSRQKTARQRRENGMPHSATLRKGYVFNPFFSIENHSIAR